MNSDSLENKISKMEISTGFGFNHFTNYYSSFDDLTRIFDFQNGYDHFEIDQKFLIFSEGDFYLNNYDQVIEGGLTIEFCKGSPASFTNLYQIWDGRNEEEEKSNNIKPSCSEYCKEQNQIFVESKNSDMYSGKQNWNQAGPCLNWILAQNRISSNNWDTTTLGYIYTKQTNEELENEITSDQFGQDANHNFCRNTWQYGSRYKPWCFTDPVFDADGWSYCDIPDCDECQEEMPVVTSAGMSSDYGLNLIASSFTGTLTNTTKIFDDLEPGTIKGHIHFFFHFFHTIFVFLSEQNSF